MLNIITTLNINWQRTYLVWRPEKASFRNSKKKYATKVSKKKSLNTFRVTRDLWRALRRYCTAVEIISPWMEHEKKAKKSLY